MTERSALRRRQPSVRSLVLALGLLVFIGAGFFTPRTPPTPPAPPTTLVPRTAPPDFIPADSSPSIIPNPNSGVEPKAEGDRGSASQYIVFALMVAGMGAIVLLIRRESRQKRAINAIDSGEPG